MSELAAKLARRRQLNGEGGTPPATATVAAAVATPVTAPALVAAPAPIAPVSDTTAPPAAKPSATSTSQAATIAPPTHLKSLNASSGKAKPATIAVSPVQPQRGVVPTESIDIFSLASRENKVVMEHMKGEPGAPIHVPRMQHLHHVPAAPRSPAPVEKVLVVPVQPIAAASTATTGEPVMDITAPEVTPPSEESVLAAPVVVSASDVSIRVVKKVSVAATSTSTTADTTDMDDLAGFEGFLDSLDDSRFEKKVAAPDGTGVRRGSSQLHLDSATDSGASGGSLFVDDQDLDVGLAGVSADVFSMSAQQSADLDSADDDDEEDHRGLPDATRHAKRRSRFGSHDLLASYGFKEEDIGDALLSMTESNDALLGATAADNSAEEISSLFAHGESSTLREELGNLHSLGGYQALLSNRRDDTSKQHTPSVDSVKAAHSRLNTFGLFGDEPGVVGALEASGAKNGGHTSSGNLFKDDVNFSQQTRRGVMNDSEDNGEKRWNERKVMAYDDFLAIMQLPACLPMWDAVQRFLYSVLGDGDGMLDAKKNMFEKVSKLETFQGTRDLDVRCQNFFDDMVDYWSKHAMFKDCHEELHMSMRDCLERYVMGKLSVVAMKYVEDKDEDERLLRRMELLSFVTPEALDVRPGLRNDIIWELAASELRKMNSFSLPVDKIACVVRCAAILFRSLNLTRAKGDDNAAGADDFLPVFIYVVMHSNVQKLHTNCEYIQQFHNPAHLMSKAGYCFVNLRSAMEFVLSADSSSVSMDPVEFDEKFNEAQRRVDAKTDSGRLPISPIAVQKEEGSSKNSMQSATEIGNTNGTMPSGPLITPIKDESAAVSCSLVTPGDVGASFVRLETVVVKGSMGIGLDISASAENGRAVVRRFKAMPPGVVNPAANCNPPIVPADIIVAVNGRDCSQLGDVVAAIKSSGEQVRLTLERNILTMS